MNASTRKAQQPVAMVTGANTGIGLVTATELARKGYRVFVTCRSPDKGQATTRHILDSTGERAEFLQLDLAEFDSVRRAAETFLAGGHPLALLVNNAGVARLRGVASSGFENTFAINHLGTFLLTNLLLPRIEQSGPARIVTVSSEAHYYARGIPWDKLTKPTSYSGMPEYAVSKLANALFSAELARRLAGSQVRTYALHPGRVATDVFRNAPAPLQWFVRKTMLSREDGAKTSLYCATSDEVANETGLFYDACKHRLASEAARNAELAKQLWERSLDWTGLRAPQRARDRSPGSDGGTPFGRNEVA